MRIKIGTKLIGGSMLMVLLVAALASYSFNVSQKTLEESVGKSSVFLAEEIMNRIDQRIHLKIEELQSHANHLILQESLSESNRAFEKLASIEEYINQKDGEWVSTPKDEITPFMQELITRDLSNHLRGDLIEFHHKKYGYKTIVELFVTNRYGANVAQSGKTSDYRQDDEEWWQIAREKGHYISDVEYDESTGESAISLGMRIDDEEGDFIGVMKAVVAVKSIIRSAEITVKRYETTRIKLITKDGRLIYSTRAFKFLEDVSDKSFFKQIKGESGFFVAKKGGKERLYSYVLSKGYRDFEGLGWILVVGHDVQEILKPAFQLRNRLAAASLILVAIGIIIAFFMSRSITKPLTGVRNAAVEISQGNLDKKIEVTSRDEIGQLAHAFNDMTDKLKVSYSGLEKKVRERTKELEKAIKELESEITVRKEAEEELAKHREHLEEMVRERTTELDKRISEVEQLNSAMINLMEDLRVSNESLETTTRQLGYANKELESFSYSVSHDLRAPLRAIDGFSKVLLEEYIDTLDEQGKHYLQRVRAGTQNMGQLIDDILNLSRIGRQPIKMKEIHLESIAKEVYKSMEIEWKDRKIDFTAHKCPSTHADSNLIKIVFTNLLSNAIKFTKNIEKAKIEIGSETKDKQTVFFVKDNGVGFDMKYSDKLFTPFQRLHRTEEYEGSGIGLAIVQRIIHRHGGKIWVESKLDKGTSFYFTL